MWWSSIFKVSDIFFTFDLDLPENEEEEEEAGSGGASECLWAAVRQLSFGSSDEDSARNNNAGEEELAATEVGEEDQEDEVVMKLLLFYVEMSSEESKEVAIVQLNDLRQTAPEQLLKFLESNIDIKSDDEESEDSEVKSEYLGTV